MNVTRTRILLALLFVGAVVCAVFLLLKTWIRDETVPFEVVYTLAGAPGKTNGARFEEPFGLTVGRDGSVYVSDGEKGRLWQIKPDGSARVVIDNLQTPSGVGVAPDGSLVIAETGAHVIRRVFPEDGRSEVIAGTVGRAGFSDGAPTSAIFNGPIGLAVGGDGTIFVADTYNDRIRAIDKEGSVRTVAGGSESGFADSPIGADARFNTPSGIAVTKDGALIIADTGNHRIRRIENDGSVRTIAGSGNASSEDGLLFASAFQEPIGIAVGEDGTIYVADSKASTVRSCGWNLFPRVWTLAGGKGAGFRDGQLSSALLNHPTGIALAPDGSILVADSGNKLVRSIGRNGGNKGSQIEPAALSTLNPTASEFRSAAPPRWPYDPPNRPREIAATFGEIRGELTETDREAWFHNGLDIPGAYGESVRAVRTERILDPDSVQGLGTTRERIRFPTLGYIHLRIGRDANDRVVDESRFLMRQDKSGRVIQMRVRRGTLFEAGEVIGTLNNQNHVHLIAGSIGREFNAIAALELPGIKDTVAPTIEPDGVRLLDASWRELRSDERSQRIRIEGAVRIVVRAYDQMDGNAKRRRLGLYRLGYQLLRSDGTPAPGFAEPLMNILFESLPHDEAGAALAYATGSRSGATGETIFSYIVTNVVRDNEARESVLSTSGLAAGDYTVRVFAEDFFGNRATQDVPVRVN